MISDSNRVLLVTRPESGLRHLVAMATKAIDAVKNVVMLPMS